MLDVRETLRRLRLSEAERQVARDLGLSRNTVAKCRFWAEEKGFLVEDSPLPDLQTLTAALPSEPLDALPGPKTSVAPYHAVVAPLLEQGGVHHVKRNTLPDGPSGTRSRRTRTTSAGA